MAVVDDTEGTLHSLEVADAIGAVVADPHLLAVAIDMPIGLPAEGPRACDAAARRLCGPRRASVFPAPARAVLGAPDHRRALARSRAAIGRGLSLQTWHLVPRIAELDEAMSPAVQVRVREAHPELAFARLLGQPARHPKRSAEGRAERIGAILGAGVVRDGDRPWERPPRGAAPDDVLDALALTTVARRLHRDAVEVLGDGEVDERGLRAEIVW